MTSINNDDFNSSCLCLGTNLRGTDTDMTVQEVVSDFKLITSAVENVLRKQTGETVNHQSKARVSLRCDKGGTLSPWGTVASSALVSSGSAKSAGSYCP